MRGGRTLSGGANDETRLRIVALAAALTVNIAFLFALGFLMRPPRAVAVTSPRGFTGAMQVWLLDRSPAMALAPMAVTPSSSVAGRTETTAAPRRANVGARSGSASSAMQAHLDAQPPAAPAPQLFDADGTLRLPEAHASAPENDVMTHRDVLPYQSTRLEGAWVRKDETLGGEMLRKATVSHRWRNRYGTQIQCAWMLVLGGCSWGHEPQATIEELKRMRVDPPLPKATQ